MLTALPASAHDTLVDSDPAADEVVTTTPEELVLTFSGEISDLGVQFVVTGPQGRDVVQGTPTVEGITVTQELADELVNGDYEATWRVTSSDGHPISGTIPFTIDAEDAADNGPATDAPTGESTPTQEPTASTTPDASEGTTGPATDSVEPTDPGSDAEVDADAADTDPTEPSGGIPAWGWLVAVLAAVGLVACGFLAFRRN